MQILTDRLDSVKFFSGLVIGRYKSGKTESIATYRHLVSKLKMGAKKLYVYDWDLGAAPLIRRATAEGWLQDICLFRYDSTIPGGRKIETTLAPPRPADPFLDWIKDINHLHDEVDPATGYWRPGFMNQAPACVLIDSLTSFSDASMDFTFRNLGHEPGAAGTHGGADYGKHMSKLVECIKSVRTLPCIFIMTAHESVEAEIVGQPGRLEQEQPKLTGERYVLPVVTGKLAFTIGALFDVVVYTTVSGDDYRWRIKPMGDIKGVGSRLQRFTATTIPQDLGQLVG